MYEPFWTYLAARHSITMKRLRREPWPWTDDPILRDYRFPNVYRELDRGTQYLIHELLPQLQPKDVLFNLVAYRHFNKIETSRLILPLRDPIDLDRVEEILDGCGFFPYTNAYRTSVNSFMGTRSQIKNSIEAMKVWMEDLDEKLLPLLSGRMRGVVRAFEEIPGVGPFVAYVIACDLTYTRLVGYDENDDCFPHTGSIAALRELTGFEVNREMARDKCYELLGLHEDELDQLGFEWWEGKTLSVRSIEDGLCEFMKYQKAVREGPRSLNRFRRPRYVPRARIVRTDPRILEWAALRLAGGEPL